MHPIDGDRENENFVCGFVDPIYFSLSFSDPHNRAFIHEHLADGGIYKPRHLLPAPSHLIYFKDAGFAEP